MIRSLAQTQEIFSTADVERCAFAYCGPPQGVEFILSQQWEIQDGPAQGVAYGSAHHFAAAVRNYGIGNRAWEPLIRKFIRKGVDIHARVNGRWTCLSGRQAYDVSNAGYTRPTGTPLDELFLHTSDPSGGKETAEAWLRILSSEGYDVQAYLLEEVAIHAAQNQLTWISRPVPCCRRLCFEMGETPGVWWEWCPDPLSHIPLVQAEFSQITLLLDEWDLGSHFPVAWQDRWPFDHPTWSDDPRMWELGSGHWRDWRKSSERQQLDLLAQKRADRRFAKRVRKSRRGQGWRVGSQMPGSWIE